jgi:hypothetical protein
MPAVIRSPSPTYPTAHPAGRGSPFLERLPPDPVRCRPLGSTAALRQAALATPASVSHPLAAAVKMPTRRRGDPAPTVETLPKRVARTPLSPKQGYQLGDLLKAIDEGNHETLSVIRDNNFSLFLTGRGLLNPLQYAMNTHNDAMIVGVIGVLSSWVNRLDAATLATREGREILKQVRGNLHLAIRFAIENHVPAALASYVQTLVMSEGDTWLREVVETVAREVGAGRLNDALGHAERAMQRFLVDALKKGGGAEVEDYRLNATTDLLMMGCAHALGKPIGVHCFARDRRVLDELRARIRDLKRAAPPPLQEKLLQRCERIVDIMGAGNLGYTGKIESLLDPGGQQPRRVSGDGHAALPGNQASV